MAYSKYLEELVSLSAFQKEQLDKYYNILFETSKVMNLTTITEEEEVYIKHFYDSILCLNKVDKFENMRLLDIGSGAGFPGIVLKIVYPKLSITLLEPTKKRCDFLEKVIKVIGLNDINVVNDRAENYIKNCRESYDIVSARAVASLEILSELALPYVKKDGYFIAMKGQNYQEEIDKSKHAISILGGIINNIYTYELPKNCGSRSIIMIKKVKNTPEIYPRIFAKIKKNPL